MIYRHWYWFCPCQSPHDLRKPFPTFLPVISTQFSQLPYYLRKPFPTPCENCLQYYTNSASRKILREKLELHSTSKKSLNIAKMVEKRFELPTSTHDLSYEKIRLADCHKIPPESVNFCWCIFHSDSNVDFCRISRCFLFWFPILIPLIFRFIAMYCRFHEKNALNDSKIPIFGHSHLQMF